MIVFNFYGYDLNTEIVFPLILFRGLLCQFFDSTIFWEDSNEERGEMNHSVFFFVMQVKMVYELKIEYFFILLIILFTNIEICLYEKKLNWRKYSIFVAGCCFYLSQVEKDDTDVYQSFYSISYLKITYKSENLIPFDRQL